MVVALLQDKKTKKAGFGYVNLIRNCFIILQSPKMSKNFLNFQTSLLEDKNSKVCTEPKNNVDVQARV